MVLLKSSIFFFLSGVYVINKIFFFLLNYLTINKKIKKEY
jgi:hypothetical protein